MTNEPNSDPLASQSAAPQAPMNAPPEHEVKPPSPRSLRTMALVRWLLLAVVTALAGYTTFTFWGPSSGGHATAERVDKYYCAMHPEIRSPEPGECPICHMTLELIPEGRKSSGKAHDSHGPAAPSGVTEVTVSEETQRAAGLVTSPVQSLALGDRLRVPAIVVAPESGVSQVHVRTPGFVEKVFVRQTSVKVTRGQALAAVYSPDLYRAQEEYLAASSWGDSESPELKTASRRSLELLGMAAQDIEAIEKSGKPLRAVPIRSTENGYVTRFSAILGSRAEPEMILYEIADLSTVWLVASVSERDVALLTAKTQVEFHQRGSDEDNIKGQVALIEPLVDEATRTARVRISIKNSDGKLRPGQFGEIVFELPATTGLFVPRDAVIRTGEHDYVYVFHAPDTFSPKEVTTGLSRDGQLQILSGLSEGDRVVNRGSFMLDSESRLQSSLKESEERPKAAAPDACNAVIDGDKFPQKLDECRACERQHAGMGTMAEDCKNAIAKPWR